MAIALFESYCYLSELTVNLFFIIKLVKRSIIAKTNKIKKGK